jgi:hypothetical protein
MIGCLGCARYLVDEIHRLDKVGELEGAFDRASSLCPSGKLLKGGIDLGVG